MSLLDLRRRIKSVKNTQKITKAMQLVAASKMKRAQDAALKSRPYADELRAVIGELVSAADGQLEHPFFAAGNAKGKTAYILFTGDRGLCGSFNSNAIRTLARTATGSDFAVIAVGRKGAQFYRNFPRCQLAAEFENLADKPKFLDIVGVARAAVDGFLSGEFSEIKIIYNHFVSTMTQETRVEQLLPLPRPAAADRVAEYLFEPGIDAVLGRVLPRFVETKIWQSLLESNASEQSARMIAMKNATDNAKSLQADLTLDMNKQRQAMITKEISEIVAGAESMAG